MTTGQESRLWQELHDLKCEAGPTAERIAELEAILGNEHPEIFFWTAGRIYQ